jgi:hypothetical protein
MLDQETATGRSGQARAGSAEQPAPWHSRAAAALVVLHGALAWIARTPEIGLLNDSASYMLLARSLRHFTYVDAHIVGSPLHTNFPPGLPAFVALLTLPFGEHPGMLLGVVVLCSMATLALLFDMISA